MIAAGANVINIPDTTGYCLPWEFGEIVRRAITEARGTEKALFSVHSHNDLGLAVANTLAALAAGAPRVECTINGIGESAAHTPPEEAALQLNVRQANPGLHCTADTKGSTPAYGQVDGAWERFLQVADTKKEVTDEDLRKIAAAAAEPNGHEANGNGHETNGHPPVTDQLLDHNHVADTLRHLIFG